MIDLERVLCWLGLHSRPDVSCVPLWTAKDKCRRCGKP